MEDRLTVSIEELRQVCQALLDHVAAIEGTEIQLDQDFFWAIPPSELYNVYSPPQALTVGQLSESWANLQALVQDDESVNAYSLVWLADILRAIGYVVVR